jgi:hypothetical protein
MIKPIPQRKPEPHPIFKYAGTYGGYLPNQPVRKWSARIWCWLKRHWPRIENWCLLLTFPVAAVLIGAWT